jgi:hypothetical protein
LKPHTFCWREDMTETIPCQWDDERDTFTGTSLAHREVVIHNSRIQPGFIKI